MSLVALGGLVAAASASASTSLLLPQPAAFSILGYSCGGIQEKAFATGFDPVSGYPLGDVYLSTTCSSGGRGSRPSTHTAWAAVKWDFAGTVASATKLTTAPTVNPTLSATDAYGVNIYNSANRAYMTVPAPGTPSGVTAVQTGDQFQVGWTPASSTSVLVSSSTITATPVASTAPVLTGTVSGSASSGLIGPLQPDTTYQITVISSDAAGSSGTSSPITVTSHVSSIPPSAPSAAAHWTAPGLPGDMLDATWTAPTPGDSPVDQYQVSVNISGDSGAVPSSFAQTVSGSTFSAGFGTNDAYDWSVQVRAHNAAGWGPWSTAVILHASN
jgi:hypothetical protein